MPLDPNRVQAAFLAAVECHEPATRAAVLDRQWSTDVVQRRRVEGSRVGPRTARPVTWRGGPVRFPETEQ